MIKSSAIIARKEEGILYTRSCMTEMANFSKDFLLLMVTDQNSYVGKHGSAPLLFTLCK
jgi:hypothetical protein